MPVAPPLPCPKSLDLQSVFEGIWWHQRWEIFEGVFTPGRNPVAELASQAGLPEDLSGARVLDVGAFNCCFSFECERRGASEVVALDLQPAEQLGFTRLKHLLQSKRVRFENGSAYALDPHRLGEFDVVLFFGVLYHLRYPLLALDQLRKVTRGSLYLETLVIDHRFIAEGNDWRNLGDYHPSLTGIALWQFYKSDELAGDFSNWFGPNIRAVLDGLESAGFAPELVSAWGDRAAFRARPLTEGAEGFRKSYEGMSDIVRREFGFEPS
jgi:tRNA (mo5U34)-methyltransferase